MDNLSKKTSVQIGQFCYKIASELFPIHRSLSGPGVDKTLEIVKKYLDDVQISNVGSGERVFDWTVPDEWTFRRGYIEDSHGNRVLDTVDHNLHIVAYSEPVDKWVDLYELQEHLYSIPENPDLIPYVTSYYRRQWGFCMRNDQRERLADGRYHVVIDADLKPGNIKYGEIIIPGESEEEVILSTYICHPSMGNNEVSGPSIAIAIGLWLLQRGNLRKTYRILFLPETIGAIIYISRNLERLKEKTIAGYVLTCLGDDREYSFLPSRYGNTLADKVAMHILEYIDPNYKKYTWLDRGSDERQFCAPGVDLPFASIMRTKYGEYPEYHTSGDNLDFISPAGLAGGFAAIKSAIEAIELYSYPIIKVLCEPQLGKYGLYPNIGTKENAKIVQALSDTISFCDGKNSTLDIAEKINQPISEVGRIVRQLYSVGLIEFKPC